MEVELTEKEENLRRDIIVLRELISDANKDWGSLLAQCHHKIGKDRAIARCIICGKGFGWWCPESPDHFCHYSKSYDSCDFCGEPEERK